MLLLLTSEKQEELKEKDILQLVKKYLTIRENL